RRGGRAGGERREAKPRTPEPRVQEPRAPESHPQEPRERKRESEHRPAAQRPAPQRPAPQRPAHEPARADRRTPRPAGDHHHDNDAPVLAFGDHMPDFLKRPVKLPPLRKEPEPEAA